MINQIVFEDEDIELLNKALPDFPCSKCSEYESCLGCSKTKEYYNKIKEYKDRKIFNIANSLQHLRNLKLKKEEIEKEYNENYKILEEAIGKEIHKIII